MFFFVKTSWQLATTTKRNRKPKLSTFTPENTRAPVHEHNCVVQLQPGQWSPPPQSHPVFPSSNVQLCQRHHDRYHHPLQRHFLPAKPTPTTPLLAIPLATPILPLPPRRPARSANSPVICVSPPTAPISIGYTVEMVGATIHPTLCKRIYLFQFSTIQHLSTTTLFKRSCLPPPSKCSASVAFSAL